MIIDTWYEWLMVYFYQIGDFLLLLTSYIIVRKTKNLYGYIALISFLCFILGGYIQKTAQSEIVESKQTLLNQESAEIKFLVGRTMGSIGFFIGTLNLVLFSISIGKRELT